MIKKKKIFIALNNYEIPNALMNYGVNLAKNLDRNVTLIGVEKMPVLDVPVAVAGHHAMYPNTAVMEDVMEHAEIKMNRLQLAAKNIYQQVEYDLEIGFPESKLIQKAEEEHPFLVVVEGSNELTSLHEWFGTYETRLAEDISAPVLVVPKDENWHPVNRIVYLMDINDNGVENMRLLSQLAGQTGADITVAVVTDEQIKDKNVKYLTMIKTFRHLLQYQKMTYMQVFAEQAAEMIEDIISEKDADWLAFQHQDNNLLQRIFNNYNTQRLILNAEVPVLVF